MPENFFKMTETRLSRSTTEVVFNRLEKIRPLTELDLILKEKLRSKEGRLFYAAYGPDPLKYCSWCAPDSSSDYFRYLIAGVAAIHIAHMFVIGIVTSSTTIDNPDGAYFRTYATIAGLAIAAIETYALGNFSPNVNAIAITPADVKWRYWDAIFYRGIAIAVVDSLLGYVIYLSATRRIDLGLRTDPVENVQLALMKLTHIESKLTSTREVRNTSMRDANLRRRVNKWWDAAAAERKQIMSREDAKQIRETIFESEEGQQMKKICKKKAKAIVGPLYQHVQQVAPPQNEEDA